MVCSQGRASAFDDAHTFRVLGSLEKKLPRGWRALLAAAIFAVAILLVPRVWPLR